MILLVKGEPLVGLICNSKIFQDMEMSKEKAIDHFHKSTCIQINVLLFLGNTRSKKRFGKERLQV